jgi:hypothetical protein
LRYAITVDQDRAVKLVVASIEEGQWKEPKRGGGDEIAETIPWMNQPKAFRLVVKREVRRQGELLEKGGGRPITLCFYLDGHMKMS